MLLVSVKTVEVYEHIKIIPGKQCPQICQKEQIEKCVTHLPRPHSGVYLSLQ